MTSRRSFLFGAAALIAAPSIVRADSLMKLWVPKREALIPFEPPMGFLPCDGRAVMREMYADLFKIIGTQFGAGDGRTTFNVPSFLSTPDSHGLKRREHVHGIIRLEHVIVAAPAPQTTVYGQMSMPVGTLFQKMVTA